MTLKHLTEIPEISPEEAYRRQETGAIIIDVRENTEWQEVHVQGARHIPLGQLPQVVEKIKEMSTQGEIITVCAHGIRSARAAEMLIQAGVKATSVAGGTSEWIAARLPVIAGDCNV